MLKLKLQSFWPPDAKNWLTRKDPGAGKDWRREEKGMTEDEMVGWHHRFNGHEFQQTLGVGDGQGSLACCSPWGHNELDTTEQLNWLIIKPKQYFSTGGNFVTQTFGNAFQTFLLVTTELGWGWGMCCWYLVGKGQGCCSVPHNAQDFSLQQRMIQPNMLEVKKLNLKD